RLRGFSGFRNRGERADVTEHRRGVDVLAAERESRRQQILRHFFGGELADQLALLVAEALLLQARVDSRLEQHGVDRLREVVLSTHLEASNDAVQLVER